MTNSQQLEAFIAAAETGSFSAAARKLGKAQSAVSTMVSNLEIETNIELFDRSSRNPTLTESGKSLLAYAYTVMHSQHEFMAKAQSLGEAGEENICLAIEQNIPSKELLVVLQEFAQKFPHNQLELLDPGSGDVAELLRTNRADIGLMIEQEVYPQGFSFRGLGYSKVVAVCHPEHPLSSCKMVSHSDLRKHRQLVGHSLNQNEKSHERYIFGPNTWLSESPHVILELLCANLGWALLHHSIVEEKIASGELIALKLAYQQADILQGIDVVWTENRPLGLAGQWLLNRLLEMDIGRQ